MELLRFRLDDAVVVTPVRFGTVQHHVDCDTTDVVADSDLTRCLMDTLVLACVSHVAEGRFRSLGYGRVCFANDCLNPRTASTAPPFPSSPLPPSPSWPPRSRTNTSRMFLVRWRMASMAAARDGATSARRRRDRQLRAFRPHELLTVKMDLATALHHSAQRPKKRVVEELEEEEVHKTNEAPR